MASQVVLDTPPENLGLSSDLSFEGFLSLFNAADQAQEVDLRLLFRGVEYQLPELSLQPRTTGLIALRELQQSGQLPEGVTDGFILGSHSGPRGTLIGEIVSVDETADYVLSTPLESSQGFAFFSKDWTIERNCNTLLSLLNVTDERAAVELVSFHGGVRYATMVDIGPPLSAGHQSRPGLGRGSSRPLHDLRSDLLLRRCGHSEETPGDQTSLQPLPVSG